MEWLIWIGAAVTMAGVGGLLTTAWGAYKLRLTGRDDPQMRAQLQRMVNRNLISLGVAVLGLMSVIMGIALR